MDAIERLIFTAAAAVIVGAASFPSSRYVQTSHRQVLGVIRAVQFYG